MTNPFYSFYLTLSFRLENTNLTCHIPTPERVMQKHQGKVQYVRSNLFTSKWTSEREDNFFIDSSDDFPSKQLEYFSSLSWTLEREKTKNFFLLINKSRGTQKIFDLTFRIILHWWWETNLFDNMTSKTRNIQFFLSSPPSNRKGTKTSLKPHERFDWIVEVGK